MSEQNDRPILKGKLSRIQAQIVVFIYDFTEAENGRSPSIREVLEATDLKSTSGIDWHFNRLVEKGWIEMTGQEGDTRRVRVPGAEYKNPPLPESVRNLAAKPKPETEAMRQLREHYNFVIK